MNWSKAKTVLIIIFLVLNVFLLVNVLGKYSDNSRTLVADTKKILSISGVEVNCDIPVKTGNVGMLEYDTTYVFDREKLAKILLGDNAGIKTVIPDNEVQINGSSSLLFVNDFRLTFETAEQKEKLNVKDKTQVERLVRSLIRQFGMPAADYYVDHFARIGQDKAEIKLIQEYKKYPVFDNYVLARVGTGGIERLELQYHKVKGLAKGNVKIIQASQLLLNNFNNKGKMKINAIELGFKGYSGSADQPEKMVDRIVGPVWRVKTSVNGIPRYFKANSGEEVN